jgi:zinc transport system substrate-binding protein
MKKVILILTLAVLVGCSESPTGGTGTVDRGKPVVAASNYPLYFFASEIAGDTIDVQFPNIDGDPAMWAPSGADVRMFQQADLVITNGAGYESWLAFTTLPEGLLLDTTAHVQDRLLPTGDTTVHQHGPEGEHSHEATAFTTWLDPSLAIEQARTIAAGLVELVPGQAEEFNANLERLEIRLLELDRTMRQALSFMDGEPIVFSHPVYQYLQQRYDINGRSLHWEPGVEPGTRDWIDLQKLLREHPSRVLVWEAPPLSRTEDLLGEMGVYSVVFEPLGNRTDQGDYLAVMNRNAANIEALARALGFVPGQASSLLED